MKVLVAGLRSIPSTEGGVETHARNLYPLIVSQGWEVEVAVREQFHEADAPCEWRGIRIHPLWAPKTPGVEALIHTLLATIYAIRTRPDVFHLHAVGPALMTPLARLFGLRVVVTHHGPDYNREKWNWFARFVLRLGERFGMRFANCRIVISQTIRDLVKKRCGQDSVVIPNGVDPPPLVTGEETIAGLGLTPGRYLLQVSRFVPEKRQIELLRAFQLAGLDDWKLVFVGDANPRKEYPAKVRKAGANDDRVVFAGFRTGNDLAELFTHAGLFVLPSSHEGLPIALLEALSYGLPVVASDITANAEIGLPGSSYFPVGNINALADRLQEHAGRPDSSEERQRRIRWVLDRYNWQRIACQTVEVYESVVSEAAD